MSALPEAKLAREAEMVYQMICMATDYDCWHSTEDVDVAMVMGHMAANAGNAKRLVGAVLDELTKSEHEDLVKGTHWVGSTTGMIKFMTKPEGRREKGVKNVEVRNFPPDLLHSMESAVYNIREFQSQSPRGIYRDNTPC